MIRIDRNSSLPFYQQIHHAVVEGIRSGVYQKGDRLPSIRSLASELGVSRNTVEQAYLLLAQEDYAQPLQGSGYYVNSTSEPRGRALPADDGYRRSLRELLEHSPGDAAAYRFDFRPGATDPRDFPFYRWARLSRDVMLDPGREAACQPGDPRGTPELREQIARSLARDTDIIAHAQQIAVFPSVSAAMASLLSLFDRHADSFRMADPGDPEVAAAARSAGFPVIPLAMHPVLREADLHAGMSDAGTSIAYCNPCSAYPLNRELPEEERIQLVEWAAQTESYVLEDERGWEFVPGNQRLPSLHALDPQRRVVFLGSFSQTLSPASCLAYLVLPPQLMTRWLRACPASMQVPWQAQETLAQMMRQNLWGSHVRRLRASNRAKRGALAAAIDEYLGETVEYVLAAGSRHALVRTRDARDPRWLARRAAEEGIGVQSTEAYWLETPPADWDYLLLDFAALPAEDIASGIRLLAQAWRR